MRRVTSAVLIAAFILAAGCAEENNQNTRCAEETTEATTEVSIEETTEVTIETTVAMGEKMDPSVSEPESEIDVVPMFAAYYALADELHAKDDKMLFSFEGDKFLAMDENEIVTPYHYEDGAIKELTSETLLAGQGDFQYYSFPETFFDYDTFVKMPVPVQLIRSDAKLVDTIKDSGSITGVVLGFDSTGSNLFALYSEIVRFTYDEIRDLQQGDALGKGTDFVVFAVSEGDDGNPVMELSHSSTDEGDSGYTLCINPSNGLYEIKGSGNYTYSNIIGLATMPIADGCEITDSYSDVVTDQVKEEYDQKDKMGVPVFDTLYWFSQSRDQDYVFPQDYRQLENGWYCADGRFDATVIGGEIVKINFYNS